MGVRCHGLPSARQCLPATMPQVASTQHTSRANQRSGQPAVLFVFPIVRDAEAVASHTCCTSPCFKHAKLMLFSTAVSPGLSVIACQYQASAW
jgi:hypothetical protein